MTRKKISDDDPNAAVVAELDNDEEFIVDTTTTKRVRREKRSEPVPTPPVVIEEPELEESDAEIVTPFSPDSLAAMIYADDEEASIANEFCTIAVRRTPDAMGDDFATPCATVTNLPRLPNVEITADRADVEDRVRREYGGGHYFFQIRTATGLGRSWRATLSDLPKHLREEPPSPTAEAAAQPAAALNPFDSLLDTLKKQREMRELLFGDEEKRMREELAELRQKLESKTGHAEPQSDLALAVSLLRENRDPGIVDFIRDAVLPSDEAEPKTSIWDFAKYALDNKEQVAGLVSMVLGGLLPAATPSPSPANVLAALRSQPPQMPAPAIDETPSPSPSRFTRKTKAARSDDDTGEQTTPEDETK